MLEMDLIRKIKQVDVDTPELMNVVAYGDVVNFLRIILIKGGHC